MDEVETGRTQQGGQGHSEEAGVSLDPLTEVIDPAVPVHDVAGITGDDESVVADEVVAPGVADQQGSDGEQTDHGERRHRAFE